MENTIYDLVIIGGGPAGLTAGIYALRANLNALLLESETLGGEVNKTFEVANYPGFSNIGGFELMQNIITHAKQVGLNTLNKNAVKINNAEGVIKEIVLNDNSVVLTKTIILAVGAKTKKLGAIGEEEFSGRGVSYCAVCDGAFFRNQTVSVIGGGNTAMENAIYLSNICEKVYIINRSTNYKADAVLLNRAKSQKNIEFIENAVVKQINGDTSVKSIDIEIKSQEIINKQLNVGGVFISIGKVADTSILPSVKTDEFGYIVTDQNMQTSVSGIYACGDIISKPLKQIITACSDGAVAATSASNYILNK